MILIILIIFVIFLLLFHLLLVPSVLLSFYLFYQGMAHLMLPSGNRRVVWPHITYNNPPIKPLVLLYTLIYHLHFIYHIAIDDDADDKVISQNMKLDVFHHISCLLNIRIRLMANKGSPCSQNLLFVGYSPSKNPAGYGGSWSVCNTNTKKITNTWRTHLNRLLHWFLHQRLNFSPSSVLKQPTNTT